MKRFNIILGVISVTFALNYHGVALAPNNTDGWAVRIDTALIYHTTNGGATWQVQTNTPDSLKRFFDISCYDQSSAWTCGLLGEILHTDNGGLDWIRQAVGLSKYATRVEFIDQDKGWAACGDGTVGRTVDAVFQARAHAVPTARHIAEAGLTNAGEPGLYDARVGTAVPGRAVGIVTLLVRIDDTVAASVEPVEEACHPLRHLLLRIPTMLSPRTSKPSSRAGSSN